MRALSLSGRIARVVGIEEWFVVGFGRGTVLEASFGSKLLPIDLAVVLATPTGLGESV